MNNKTKRTAASVNVNPETMLDIALDFLLAAINKFQNESLPRLESASGIIFMATGVELLLKQHLMAEHWTLVVSGKPNLHEFNNGTAHTRGFSECLESLETVCGISVKFKEALQELAARRNALMHFGTIESEPAYKDLAARALYAAIAFIHSQYPEYWSENAKSKSLIKYKIDQINSAASEFTEYTTHRMSVIAADLAGLEKRGLLRCPRCHHVTAFFIGNEEVIDCRFCETRNDDSELIYSENEAFPPGCDIYFGASGEREECKGCGYERLRIDYCDDDAVDVGTFYICCGCSKATNDLNDLEPCYDDFEPED